MYETHNNSEHHNYHQHFSLLPVSDTIWLNFYDSIWLRFPNSIHLPLQGICSWFDSNYLSASIVNPKGVPHRIECPEKSKVELWNIPKFWYLKLLLAEDTLTFQNIERRDKRKIYSLSSIPIKTHTKIQPSTKKSFPLNEWPGFRSLYIVLPGFISLAGGFGVGVW